jgi:hypothetical protein
VDEETKRAIEELTRKPSPSARSAYVRKFSKDAADPGYSYKSDLGSFTPIEKPPPIATEKPQPTAYWRDLSKETATLSIDTSEACIVLRAPMNPEIINKIYTTIPYTQRDWIAAKQIWRFSPAAVQLLKPLLKSFYKDVQTLGVPKSVPATKFDLLLAKLTQDDKNNIYKLLAMKHHPDRGGDKETMILINLVFKGG